MKIRRYRSAGGVVIQQNVVEGLAPERAYVLLLDRPGRDEIRLPKGHIDPGESAETAALPEKILYTQILPEWLDMERNLLAYHTGDRSLLLWETLQAGQTNAYDQAVAAFEDLMAMDGNEPSNEHYQWGPGQEMLLEKVKK